MIGEEGVEFGEGGGEAGEVEGDAAEPLFAGGFGGGLEVLGGGLFEDEGVDGSADPIGALGKGDIGGEWFEGPVFVVGCAFLDPAVEEVLLGVVEAEFGFEGRHDLVSIVGADEVVEVALLEVAGGDAGVAAEVGDGVFAGIETEVGFLIFGVGTVAFEAAVGDDGADVAVEVDGGFGLEEGRGKEE